jgi:hypothetical protein
MVHGVRMDKEILVVSPYEKYAYREAFKLVVPFREGSE